MQIKQVEIFSNDLAGTENFYVELLGLKVIEKNDDYICFNVGITKLIFKRSEIKKPFYHFAFNIPNNKLEEAQEWLSSRTQLIKFQNKNIIDFDNWNAKSLYFLDNNGNVLEFIARYDLKNESNKAFDASGILSISEMAFVTDNVKALALKLIQTYQFTYFEKQIQSEDFSVIGEDDGLLILVNSKRNWFPTEIKVEKFPFKILVENNNKLGEIDYQ